VNAHQLLPAARDIYSRHPEFRYLLAWEMQTVLRSLTYTDELEDEAAIQGAMDIARPDLTGGTPPAVALKGGVPRSYAAM
jgi:hypothetical protein